MERNSQIAKIKDPLFLAGLVILLLNDFFFKYAFSNGLTGKLSDVAGLFIFPYFFSAIWSQKAKIIYWFTAIAFTFWKSPFSQTLIDFGNSYGTGVNRTIDLSDLWTLLVLPFSFSYFNSRVFKNGNDQKPVILFIAFVSIFSFCATTLPHKEVNTQAKLNKVFMLEMNKEEFFNHLNSGHGYSDTLQKNLTDSLFYLYFDIPELRADVKVLANINEINSDKINVRLDSIVSCEISGRLFSGFDQDKVDELNNLKSQDYEKYFEKYFIGLINNKKGNLYFDNKEIHDKYESGNFNNLH